jgi:sulfite exporter TauE/SafE
MLMLIPVAGFIAGLHHVVAGPDHLAAVAPLAVSSRRMAWRGGFSWALGHVGGVGVIALIALSLRQAVPFDTGQLSEWAERLVGVVLIGIGLWGFRRALSRRLHSHVHEHSGECHVHVHLHEGREAHDAQSGGAHEHTHAALAVGTLHGLAGGSHILGVLPALALATSDAIVYLGAYALGTITAMVLFASVMGWVAARARSAGVPWARGLMAGCSAAAVMIGVYWVLAGMGVLA